MSGSRLWRFVILWFVLLTILTTCLALYIVWFVMEIPEQGLSSHAWWYWGWSKRYWPQQDTEQQCHGSSVQCRKILRIILILCDCKIVSEDLKISIYTDIQIDIHSSWLLKDHHLKLFDSGYVYPEKNCLFYANK